MLRRPSQLAPILICLVALSARADPPFRTEDPTIEEDGQLGLYVGIGYRHDAVDFGVLDRNWQWDIGRTRLTFGLGERVEVMLTGVMALAVEMVPVERPPIPPHDTNYGDWTLGTKIRVMGPGERHQGLSVLWEVKLPIASTTRGGGTNETDFFFHALDAWRLAAHQRLRLQLGLGLLGDPRVNSSQSDVLVTRVAWERHDRRNTWGAEALSQLGDHSTVDQVSVRGVYTRRLGERWSVYGGISVGLNDETDRWAADVGVHRPFTLWRP